MKLLDKQRKREIKRCGDFYVGLTDQIQGLIEIEVGNYLYSKGIPASYIHFDRWSNGGIEVYIFDEEIASLDKRGKIQTDYEDILLLAHLHYEDMLYFILNFGKEKKRMFEYVDRYLKFKEDYKNVEKYKTKEIWLPVVKCKCGKKKNKQTKGR